MQCMSFVAHAGVAQRIVAPRFRFPNVYLVIQKIKCSKATFLWFMPLFPTTWNGSKLRSLRGTPYTVFVFSLATVSFVKFKFSWELEDYVSTRGKAAIC